jgi:hypothetical protein
LRGFKNAFLKDKWDQLEARHIEWDPKRYVVSPYVFSHDVWKHYGLDDYAQVITHIFEFQNRHRFFVFWPRHNIKDISHSSTLIFEINTFFFLCEKIFFFFF